jgi:hypothetical protein
MSDGAGLGRCYQLLFQYIVSGHSLVDPNILNLLKLAHPNTLPVIMMLTIEFVRKTLIDFWREIFSKFNNFCSIGWKFEKGCIHIPPPQDLFEKVKSGLGADGLGGLWHGDIKTQETLSSYINT